MGLLGLLFSFSAFAQNISFFEGSFENAQAQAKQENKFLMLDFYEPGCEVCTYMFETVLKDPAVVAYFNDHYVTYKVDAIHTQPSLVEAYQAYDFPTLIFFAPDEEEIVRYEGGMKPGAFLRFVRGVVNYEENKRRISTDPYDGEALAGFLGVLEATDYETALLMATDYLEFVEEPNYSEPHNFEIISRFIYSYQSKEFSYIFENQEEFQNYETLIPFLQGCLQTLWLEAIREKDPGKVDQYAEMQVELMNRQSLWDGKNEDELRTEIAEAFELATFED